MISTELFRVGDDRLVCHGWHTGSHTVVLRAADAHMTPHPASIEQIVSQLSQRGVTRVITGVLDATGAEPFALAGFGTHECLRVLQHDLSTIPACDGPPPRRTWQRRDVARAAYIDAQAFGAQFRLDESGLRAAMTATPAYRFRMMAPYQGTAGGYAICGMSCERGYVQRLAVIPDCRRRGFARSLVSDGLKWFRGHGATRALVNTQVDNEAALRLYLGLGFTETPEQLSVLSRHCGVL